MTIFLHELRRGKLSLILWTAGISFMLGVCILIYPEMSGQMNEISAMFADMGSFSAAFGMDQLNFGEFKGYFGVECGNTLGLGGALFAALLGIRTLSKEEENHTAEFLMTHPISRTKIFTQKLLAVIAQILILNLTIAIITASATMAIGESLPIRESGLLLLSHFLLQIELAMITFGMSALVKGGSLGLGIGISLGLYVMNLISNLIEAGKLLKYITPYAYADSASIIGSGRFEIKYLLSGFAIAIICLGAGLYHYRKKDIS